VVTVILDSPHKDYTVHGGLREQRCYRERSTEYSVPQANQNWRAQNVNDAKHSALRVQMAAYYGIRFCSNPYLQAFATDPIAAAFRASFKLPAMSEYWKSTPKYWCKHCKTFVRDTKLEKQSHDATPKHQGNIKRFLRDLHRGNERDEREKQRAKDEVARLSGEKPVLSENTAASSSDNSRRKLAAPAPSSSSLRQLTPAERKRQLAQLAELGVAVPEDYRREVAMVGDWQVMSERAIYEKEDIEKEEGEEDGKKFSGLNVGVRKRKLEGREDEEENEQPVARRVWGSTTRTYPGLGADEDNLDALLATTTALRRDAGLSAPSPTEIPTMKEEADSKSDMPAVKMEESLDGSDALLPPAAIDGGASVKREDEVPPDAGVVFRKRKPKSIRQK